MKYQLPNILYMKKYKYSIASTFTSPWTEKEYTREDYLSWRKEVLSRMHTIFQHVQQHPQFVCDHPGRRVLNVEFRMNHPSPDFQEKQNVLLIQRMNENLELVQEMDIGKPGEGDSFRVGLLNGELDIVAEKASARNLSANGLIHPVTSVMIFHHLLQTDFFDALERAVQNTEIATTFEPAV